MKRAQAIDPFSALTNYHVAVILYLSRQFDQAIEQLRKTLELDPYFPRGHALLGLCYVQQRRHKEAIVEINKQITSGENSLGKMSLGYAYAVSGRRAEAMEILDEVKELSKTEPLELFHVAVVYSGLGESDKAFEWLEKAFTQRPWNNIWPRIKSDPYWDNIRSDPRFAELVRRMGLPP